MDDFYTLSQIPMSIIDLQGRVLVGIGWQDICTKFHRAHAETCRNCIESDLQLTAGIPQGESRLYKCKNNMWDIATPLWVGGKHVGNIFCGQFFFEGEELDYEFFRSQAKRCGFDEEAYISAMEAVPLLSRESVDAGMAFFMKLSDMISKLSYGNTKLSRSLAQRDALMASLRESREDLNRAQAVSKTGSWRMDVHKNELLWSDETHRMFEIPKGTPLTYETFISAVHPDDREYVDLKWKAAIKGEPYDLELRILAGGRTRWVREKAELAFDSTGALLGGFGTVQDITERKMAEEALRESDQRYRQLFEMESDALFLIEKETGNILEVNKAASILYGYTRDEFLTKKNTDMSAEPDQTRKATQDSLITVPIRYHKKKNGTVFSVEIAATHLKWQGRDVHIAAIRDITSRINAEKEKLDFEKRLQQAQKMEAIGTLAGGIAHDFNNILFPIMGMSEMLLEDLPPDSLEHENAQEIFKAGKRASQLVKQILAFSRQTEHQMMPIRIQLVLHEVLKLVRSTIPSNIEIVQNIQKECGLVMADPTQVHQIAMNLITNAYHAVEQTGGEISIQLMEIGLTRDDAEDSLDKHGQYAMLRVSDTGCGIDPAIMNRIFEPYFTTKQEGKGTGLGLSIVYGIVKEHRGDVRVFSQKGKGTTVTVYLPLVEKPEKKISAGIKDGHILGSERILLVDDEEPIARLEKQMLERLGYHVTTRTSSVEALEVFKTAPERFDLVITDMMMPNMTGIQLARELKKISPDVPIIICTGFSEHINEEQCQILGIDGFVLKPVIRSEIAQTIRNTLENIQERDT